MLKFNRPLGFHPIFGDRDLKKKNEFTVLVPEDFCTQVTVFLAKSFSRNFFNDFSTDISM